VTRPTLADETLLLLLTWAVLTADHPSQIVIESWPEPSVPLAITVLNQPANPSPV